MSASSSLHSRLVLTSPVVSKSRVHRRTIAVRCVSTTSTEEKSSRVSVVKNGDDSLAICRVLNGMWQTSGGWGRIDRDAAIDAMLRYVDAGLTTFDMADHYGPAEDLYGIFINKVRRERPPELLEEIKGLTKWVPPPVKMTSSYVRENINVSRKRMDVASLDMLQFHWWDYSNPGYIDALKHLTDLKEEGKIKTIALTNFDTERLHIILENGIPIVSNQPAKSTPHTNFTDHESLLAFRDHVTDPNGILATNWTTNTSFCSWIGITCSRRRQRVIAIRLFDLSLQGTLSPHIGNLSFLVHLSLANNTLTGPIPQELAQLHRLTYFNLEDNSLSGHIPFVIFNMSSVIEFYVSFNNLWGSVPSNHSLINMLPRLKKIYLHVNNFSGDIPVSFAQCRDLESLSLAGNQFSGTVPAEIGSLPQLAILALGGNQLTGPIPTSLGNLTKLIILDLAHNNLTGIIPKELENLQNLQHFSLTKCNIAGSIPTTLLNDSMLQFLDFSYNKLSGFVPMEIGKSLQQLQIFDLIDNQLTGGFEFLSSFSNCRNLSVFGVQLNKLEGVLPDSVGNLSMSLQLFSVAINHVIGNIPAGLGNLSGLIWLGLEENELIGAIPSGLTRLHGLQSLYLNNNRISGLIPFELGLMKSLNVLRLQNNLFFGAIPDSLANLSMIQRLYLYNNNLSSSIPQSLWTLESLIRLDLSKNTLSGSLSPQIRRLKALIYLNLSTNQLSENISDALGDLQMLTTMDLSKNSFQGEIPETFGRLISITNLNLSHNFLSGVIPNTLANLTYLDSLDLSFNKLEGKIPNGRVFSNLSISYLIGNEALCGAPQLHLSPCTVNDVNKGSIRKLKLLKYALPLAVFLVVLITCICLIYAFYWRKKVTTLASTDARSLDGHRFVSHQELIRATTNFSVANLLGRGGFSSVFRGCLDDGLLVAIKVLNLEVEGASKSFDTE